MSSLDKKKMIGFAVAGVFAIVGIVLAAKKVINAIPLLSKFEGNEEELECEESTDWVSGEN